jgi:hypothetical protein
VRLHSGQKNRDSQLTSNDRGIPCGCNGRRRIGRSRDWPRTRTTSAIRACAATAPELQAAFIPILAIAHPEKPGLDPAEDFKTYQALVDVLPGCAVEISDWWRKQRVIVDAKQFCSEPVRHGSPALRRRSQPTRRVPAAAARNISAAARHCACCSYSPSSGAAESMRSTAAMEVTTVCATRSSSRC